MKTEKLHTTNRYSAPKLLLLSLMLTIGLTKVYAQANQVFVSTQLNQHSPGGLFGVGAGTVTNATNALGSDLTNAATLNSVSLLNWAEIQMEFSTSYNAGTTVYIKVNNSSNITISSVSGSNSTTSDWGTAVNNNMSFTEVYNAAGDLFLAVTPSGTFNAIRVRKDWSLLSPSVNVYGAFVLDANPLDCGKAWAYTTDYGGVTLGWAEIANPEHAFTGTSSNYASFNVNASLLSLAFTMEETVYFDGPSNPGDAVRLEFSDGVGLLDISLFNNATIQVYNGNTAIGTAASLSDLLSLDVFGLSALFGSLDRNIIVYTPAGNAVFDRVKIRYNVPLGLPSAISQLLRVYDVQRIPQALSITGSTASAICGGSTTTLTATSPQEATVGAANLTYRWYDSISGGNLVHQGPDFTIPDTLTSDRIYWVEVQKGICGQPSVRIADTVKIIKPIAVTDADSTHEALPVLINIMVNDTLLCGALDTAAGINITTSPAHGTVTLNGNNVRYTPDAGFEGIDSFSYTLKDEHGVISLPALVTVKVSDNVILPTDLTPVINMPSQNFSASSLQKAFNIRLFNLADGNTSNGIITVVIYKSPGFTFTLSPSAATEWSYSTIGSTMVVLTSLPGVAVTSTSYKEISTTVTAATTTPKGTNHVFTVSIEDGSGGDIDNTNNSRSINVLVN